jgi:hypothetical protein
MYFSMLVGRGNLQQSRRRKRGEARVVTQPPPKQKPAENYGAEKKVG